MKTVNNIDRFVGVTFTSILSLKLASREIAINNREKQREVSIVSRAPALPLPAFRHRQDQRGDQAGVSVTEGQAAAMEFGDG